MPFYRCTTCGYVIEEEKPSEACPACLSSDVNRVGWGFEEVDNDPGWINNPPLRGEDVPNATPLLPSPSAIRKIKPYIEWYEKYLVAPKKIPPGFIERHILRKPDHNSPRGPMDPLKNPKSIIIHHAQIEAANTDLLRWFHRSVTGWSDIGYHFVIGNGVHGLSIDGEVETGRPIFFAGAHAKGHNSDTIGVCLVGNFDFGEHTKKQLDSLKKLVKKLQKRYGIPAKNVIGHRELEGVLKSCPGKNLDMEKLRKSFIR